MLGATGRDQVTSIVVLYGPRTTALVACDDGVYEFTCGEGNKWFASREDIKIKQVLPLSPKNIPQGTSKVIDFARLTCGRRCVFCIPLRSAGPCLELT
jgi:fructose-1,6-bisphosphatase